jgi:prepilin-type processing-associated H-X9-DG protein
MYAQDNQGNLARNGGEGSQPSSPTDPSAQGALLQWCPGRMDYAAPVTTEPTDPAWIKAGCIYPYVNTVTVYRCPADNSEAVAFGQLKPRTRSISMNGWVGPISLWSGTATGRIFYKESDLGTMGPANIWLLIDENPYSINDAVMAEYGPTVPPAAPNLNWVDYPASYHNGGAGISFCDGHAQIRKWTDATVLNLRTFNPPTMPPNPLTCPDLPWLQAHATSAQ